MENIIASKLFVFSAACEKQAVLRALQLVPSCHPRWESVEKGRKHREHGAHGKDGKHLPDDLNTLFMIQNYLSTRCLKMLYFTAFMATVEKVISYVLGEHDPESAQNGRTSSEM